jgi:hypothetical protein
MGVVLEMVADGVEVAAMAMADGRSDDIGQVMSSRPIYRFDGGPTTAADKRRRSWAS